MVHACFSQNRLVRFGESGSKRWGTLEPKDLVGCHCADTKDQVKWVFWEEHHLRQVISITQVSISKSVDLQLLASTTSTVRVKEQQQEFRGERAKGNHYLGGLYLQAGRETRQLLNLQTIKLSSTFCRHLNAGPVSTVGGSTH